MRTFFTKNRYQNCIKLADEIINGNASFVLQVELSHEYV